MAKLKLPFEFAPGEDPDPSKIQANYQALLDYVSDLHDGLESLQDLVVGNDLTVGGDESVTGGTTITGTLTNTNKLLTDSSGRVTQPNQPSFHVYRGSSSQTLTFTAGVGAEQQQTLTFDTEHFDLGGDIVHTTGIFTAPVDGVYMFSGWARLSNFSTINISDMSFSLYGTPTSSISQSSGAVIFGNQATGSNTPCASYVVACASLDANDTVYLTAGAANKAGSVDVDASYFSGSLIN